MGYRQDNLAKMEQKKQNKQIAGLVSERFPGVSGIIIKMQYFHKMSSEKDVNPILMDRTITLLPGGSADLFFKCMVKECEGGGFDFTRLVKTMIKSGKKILRGELICKGRHREIPADHAHVTYEVSIAYKKARK